MANEEKEQEIVEENTAEESQEAAETTETNPENEEETTEVSAEAELQAQIDSLKDRLVRSAAEFDNYKKRTAKEKEDFYAHAVCETMTQILPVLDNLQRAAAAAEVSGGEDMLEGVKMIQRQFEEALEGIGVHPIDAVGQPFDPELHNAVMRDENTDAEENTVTEEFMKGYTYNSKVIRHSMVKVAN